MKQKRKQVSLLTMAAVMLFSSFGIPAGALDAGSAQNDETDEAQVTYLSDLDWEWAYAGVPNNVLYGDKDAAESAGATRKLPKKDYRYNGTNMHMYISYDACVGNYSYDSIITLDTTQMVDKGIGTAACSEIVYKIDGGYDTFKTTIAFDAYTMGNRTRPSSVQFKVMASKENDKSDEYETLFDSGVVYTSDSGSSRPYFVPQDVSVSVSGYKYLKLWVSDAGETGSGGANATNQSDDVDWAFARLISKEEESSPSAADIAAGITEINAPQFSDEAIALPEVPEGFTVSIKSSSDESVIASDGSIIWPAYDTKVKLVLTVANGADTADTAEITVAVPGVGMWRVLLKQTIDTAKEAQQHYPQNLIPAVKDDFEAALAAAEAVYADLDATDDEIYAADKNLILMMHYLKFTANKDGLKEAIDHAKDVINSGNYLDDDKMDAYKAALAAAEALYDDDVTDTEITPAIEALRAAETELNEKPVIQLDTAELEHQINMSDALDMALYIDNDAKTTFISTLQEAKDLLAKAKEDPSSVTQEEIEAMTAKLHAARTALRLIPNKDALEELLNKANNYKAQDYTTASYAVFKAAVQLATEVYNDPLADKDDVDNAIEVLNTAIDGLVANSGTAEDPGTSEEPGTEEPNDNENPTTGSSPLLPLGVLVVLAGAGAIVLKRRCH